MADTPSEFDCSFNDMPKCPHCGYDWDWDGDLLRSQDANNCIDTDCPSCGKLMHIQVEYSVTYSTSVVGDAAHAAKEAK